MCAGGPEGELETFRHILEANPRGNISLVSDGYNLWNVIQSIFPQLKDIITSRDGNVIIRPDSGDTQPTSSAAPPPAPAPPTLQS